VVSGTRCARLTPSRMPSARLRIRTRMAHRTVKMQSVLRNSDGVSASAVGAIGFAARSGTSLDSVSHFNGPLMSTAAATPINKKRVPFGGLFQDDGTGSAAVRAMIRDTELESGSAGANSTIAIVKG
jgi:hypothetical protein